VFLLCDWFVFVNCSRSSLSFDSDPDLSLSIEDWTSSDDESKTLECLRDSKIKMLPETIKSQMLPKPESRPIQNSFRAAKQASHSSKAQRKKSSSLSVISQAYKRFVKRRQRSINNQRSHSPSNTEKQICYPPVSQQHKFEVWQKATTSSTQAPLPPTTHKPVKHQKPIKACFKCGKESHVLKKCQ